MAICQRNIIKSANRSSLRRISEGQLCGLIDEKDDTNENWKNEATESTMSYT